MHTIALGIYIDGNNASVSSISMTAPVMRSREGPHWRVACVMPAASDTASLLAPTTSEIAIRVMPPKLMATIADSGKWRQNRYDNREQMLDTFRA